jgi:hypothetical protein
MKSDAPPLLLPELMAKIAGMGPASLEAVHRFVLELELAGLVEEIKDEAEVLRLQGKLDPEVLKSAIEEHRTHAA